MKTATVLVAPMLLLAAGMDATSTPPPEAEDWVFVTEDRAVFRVGCEAVSLFSVSTGLPIAQGETHISPGRLAASRDLSIVLSSNSNGAEPFLYSFVRDARNPRHWRSGTIVGADFATLSGLAVLAGGREILIATSRKADLPSFAVLPNRPPYYIGRYRLPAVYGEEVHIGPLEGRLQLPEVPAEVFVAQDDRRAHLLTAASVHSIDVESMTEVAAPVPLSPFVARPNRYHGANVNLIHGALSMNERYLISNRGESNKLNVVDLVTRQSWSVSAGDDVKYTGGVDLNKGWVNDGLLAVHAKDSVRVLEFTPRGPMVEVGRLQIRIPGPSEHFNYDAFGPKMSIGWSSSGHRLIAASNYGASEFVVIRVDDNGRQLVQERFLTACPAGYNIPDDILTANGLVPPPITPTPTASATGTAPPTATHTTTPTASSTPTPTTTLRPPVPLFLPVALREEPCLVERRSDIALVLDASSSMLEPTSANRTKLDAAKAAAAGFLDLMAADHQTAIVAFNADAQLLQPLTTDRAALDDAIAGITVAQQTCLPCGVEVAANELDSDRRKLDHTPVLVLLTDGKSNPRPVSEAETIAAAAKQRGVVIFTIGLGEDLDFRALERIASRPGFYYHAPDAEDLGAIYAAIAVDLPCRPDTYWGQR